MSCFTKIATSSDLFRAGPVSRKQFYHELRRGAATLSPFGFGEVCFRDFEAIIFGCLLVKPDMSHVETWPNVYQPDETYVSVRWDGENLVDRVSQWLSSPEKMAEMTRTAYEVYSNGFDALEEKVAGLCEMVSGASSQPGKHC